MRRTWSVLLTNVLLTLFFAGTLAPAAQRYSPLFRFGGRTAAAAFFILPLYIGPAVLWLQRPQHWYSRGIIAGLLISIPLALWTFLLNYPLSKAPIILATGVLQGWILGRIANSPSTSS
jgi:hypothetical protein